MCKQICLYYLFIYVLSIFLAFPKVEIQLQTFYNILFIIRCMKTCAQYSHMMFLRLFLIHTKLHFYLKHLVVLRIIIIKYSVSKRKLLFDLKELKKKCFCHASDKRFSHATFVELDKCCNFRQDYYILSLRFS